MNMYQAVMICEGAEDADDQTQWVAAWQYLIDTGAAWTLQGYFGRGARDMIESGECVARTVTP